MALAVETDSSWPGGGFALLSGDGLEGVTAVTIENCLSKLLLDARGQWGKFPHPFPVEQTPSGALLLGPDIVDHVPTELFILLRDQAGAELGKLFWADVMPSRNPGSATSADVLAIHRRDVVAEAPPPEPPPAPPPGIELASVTVAPPPPPPIESTISAPPAPPPVPQEASEPPAIVPPPPPIADDEQQIKPIDDRPPVPPALYQMDDGRPSAIGALMPTWLTITLAGVFSSSLLLVVLIMMGVFERVLA